MVFNKSDCIIRKTFCGNGKIPKDTATVKYSRKGTNYECLKKGYGIADWEHRKKVLDKNSLQQIMYIGPVYEENFYSKKIYNIPILLKKMRTLSAVEKRKVIYACCKRANGSIDHRAVNSLLLFLHEHKLQNLPSCKIYRD